MSSCCGVYHQFVFLRLPQIESPKLLSFNKSPLLLQKRRSVGLSSKEAILQFIPKAASSSPSLGGSGVDYAEQLLGTKTKKKSQKIAGIEQDELLEPAVLADPDSVFCEFRGVQIHHKVCEPESSVLSLSEDGTSCQFPYEIKKVGLAMILLHGFGASVFSWDRVMKPLAQVTGSKVLAFDRPAFGLTSRVNPSEHSSPSSEDTKPLNPYSMIFSVLATLYFIDFLAAEKAILVGYAHSHLPLLLYQTKPIITSCLPRGTANFAHLIVNVVERTSACYSHFGKLLIHH